MKTYCIRNGLVVNRGTISESDVWISGGRIVRVGSADLIADEEIDASGCFVLPGIIDDQVHFREPGLTHKADIASESRAGVSGGVCSYMEMPNVKPPSITQEALEAKYEIARRGSLGNYSFYMGATNDNYDEVMRTDGRKVCGVKIFMGSSTGNMLVDDEKALDRFFANVPILIATHCEDEEMVRRNMAEYEKRYGDALEARHHPEIRSVEACLKSSSFAVNLARKYGTRLHVLHITTRDEIALFDNRLPLSEKRITAEVCVHHLHFQAADYATLGNQIKCNPAIKGVEHRDALLQALLDNHFDVVATDHAPHTWEEKSLPYSQAPAGLPLIQHTLNLMLDFYHKGQISMERIVEKMCHAPAIAYQVSERGFLDEGMWADVVILDPNEEWTVSKQNLHYKCGWSPLEGITLKGKVRSTFVSGHLAWHNDRFDESQMGQRLAFDR